MDDAHSLMQDEWQRALAKDQAKATELFGHSEEEQRRLGYFHTIREICQQPWTWLRTCDRMLDSRDGLNEDLKGIHSLALTGSGSSEYAGECVRFPLQNALGIPTESISGGALKMYGGKALPPGRPGVLVSVARSGDSPESSGAVELLLSTEPQIRHIVVTCNEHGRLARAWHETKNVRVITLPSETLDKSLVMTSSFTNLLLAVRFLGMLEITAGRVTTVCETYLGFRHGPMSYVHDDTLVVCHLSSDRTIRAYELDLLRELDRKRLGLLKVIVGENIPDSAVRNGDEVIECRGLSELGEDDDLAIHVVVAQLLAFFRCLEEGLLPDSPSEEGIINRVVEKFPLHASFMKHPLDRDGSAPRKNGKSNK